MPTIDEIQENIEKLSRKQLDIQALIQKNQAKKEVFVKQLSDEFGIGPEKIETTLKEYEKQILEDKAKLAETLKKFGEYLEKIGEKLA